MSSTQPIAHFRQVPQQPETRRRIWLEALAWMRAQTRQRPLTHGDLLNAGAVVLRASGVESSALGYAMVMLNNAFWCEQFLAVPCQRRLLLLPRCLEKLPEVRTRAEALGYKIHVAEGSPIVVRLLAEEEMDGILGIGCLDSLEKAFTKVQQVGVPAIAIPLNDCGCQLTHADMDFIGVFLEGRGAATLARTRNYLPLMRTAYQMFNGEEFSRLLGTLTQDNPGLSLGLEWLRRGGKRLRPFTTLAAYAAFSSQQTIPDGVKRVAVAMEAFHKASLVHDDIEDDDATRYGQPTLHKTHGIPVAINTGDYLLGLGYALAADGAQAASPAGTSQLLALLSRAHISLCLGQAGELQWQPQDLTLEAALKRYMLKSSPAFEAALASGVIMAGAYPQHADTIHAFCKHLGAAFQIQNDLSGWEDDALHARPTVLLALALERASATERQTLLKPGTPAMVRQIYDHHAVWRAAGELIERFRQHAVRLIDEQQNPSLCELLRFLLETIVASDPSTVMQADPHA